MVLEIQISIISEIRLSLCNALDSKNFIKFNGADFFLLYVKIILVFYN